MAMLMTVAWIRMIKPSVSAFGLRKSLGDGRRHTAGTAARGRAGEGRALAAESRVGFEQPRGQRLVPDLGIDEVGARPERFALRDVLALVVVVAGAVAGSLAAAAAAALVEARSAFATERV